MSTTLTPSLLPALTDAVVLALLPALDAQRRHLLERPASQAPASLDATQEYLDDLERQRAKVTAELARRGLLPAEPGK